ncbi:MAG: hypothetical protein NTZ58_02005 [Solirubrobacterales bacterium]|nr:hypothetical protein [Solirubrobacterales bacterium]
MGQAIKDRALPAAIVAAALLTLAPTAGAASKAKPAAGNVAARQVVLLRNDGRRAKLAPQRLVLSGSKSVAYASFSVPKTWAGKPTSLVLEAQSKVRVTVSAVRAGELRSLRWSDRPRAVGAAVSTNLLAATPTAVALPQLPSSGRLVLEIRGRGRAVITGALQISPRTGSSQPSVGGGDETPGTGGGSDVGDRPSDEEPIPGQTPAEPGSPSDPGSPTEPGSPLDPTSPFADLAPQLIGAPRVNAAALTEASGLAESAVNPGVYWTHNDSGDRARLFAIDAATGALRATFELPGVTATDWEDLAIAPDADGNDAFYIADIGDNGAARSSVKIYRAAEPTLPAAGAAAVTINAGAVSSQRLTYPGGPRDAESLAVGSDGALTVISKREAQVGVYRLADPQFTGGISVLSSVGQLPLTWVVGASASPDGSFVLIKTASAVRGYAVGSDETVADALVRGGAGVNLPYNAEPQGEAVAASLTGRGHATLSEGISQPLQQWRW